MSHTEKKLNYLNQIGFNLFLTTDRRGLKFIDTSGINNLKIINGLLSYT